jgi:hypothetical protein
MTKIAQSKALKWVGKVEFQTAQKAAIKDGVTKEKT